MAVFTAIGTAIATAIGVSTAAIVAGGTLTWAGLVGSVIGAGLAYGTAKMMGVYDTPSIAGAETRANGVKVQVAPSTDNKVHVAFGRNYCGGIIVDANIMNRNNTMAYCVVLSEHLEGATYTVNDIYWGDSKLQFTGANVTGKVDKNATTNTDWTDKIRMRVYAGNVNANAQIFPTSGAVAATTMMPHWNLQYSANNLVFAMIQVDYDAENGLTGLGAVSFDLENDVTNPGNALIRYLNNSNWGAGLSNDVIDVNSITGTSNTQMAGYCDELVQYTTNTLYGSSNANIARYQINGFLNTNDTIMDNIDKICKNSSTFFTFDGKQGKFKAVPNRLFSTAEQANAFVLNDDNITSKISVRSTELYSLYNSVKVSFADVQRKDQTNSIVLEIPSGDRNTGEPDNQLDFRAELINNNIHAELLGNIDLNQGRYGMVISLTADYSALQVDAGDIVKLTNTDYGFTDKLFKCMRNTETLTAEGMISCNLLLLEYDDSIYPEPANIVQSETFDFANIITPTLLSTEIISTNFANTYFANVPITSTDGSGTGGRLDIFKDVANSSYFVGAVHQANPLVYGGTGYSAGDNVTVSGNVLGGTDGVHDATFTVATLYSGTAISTMNAAYGNCYYHPQFTTGGAIPGVTFSNLAVGTQISEVPSDNTTMTASTSYSNIAANIDIDFTKFDFGDYTVFTNFSPIGSLANISTADFGVGTQIDVTFANGTVSSSYFDSRTRYDDQTDLPTVLNTANVLTVTPDMESGTVRLVGFNTSDQTAGTGERGYTNMKLDLLRLRKGTEY